MRSISPDPNVQRQSSSSSAVETKKDSKAGDFGDISRATSDFLINPNNPNNNFSIDSRKGSGLMADYKPNVASGNAMNPSLSAMGGATNFMVA